MQRLAATLMLVMIGSTMSRAQESSFQDAFLDRMAGDWLMEGTIAGDPSTMDVKAEWVLAHQYMRIYQVTRQKDSTGAPMYEAVVYIGWDAGAERYACLWLDVTGTSAFAPIGYGKRNGDEIPFVFGPTMGGLIHNTFSYDRESDTWRWNIDNEKDGTRSEFGRVTLKRN